MNDMVVSEGLREIKKSIDIEVTQVISRITPPSQNLRGRARIDPSKATALKRLLIGESDLKVKSGSECEINFDVTSYVDQVQILHEAQESIFDIEYRESDEQQFLSCVPVKVGKRTVGNEAFSQINYPIGRLCSALRVKLKDPSLFEVATAISRGLKGGESVFKINVITSTKEDFFSAFSGYYEFEQRAERIKILSAEVDEAINRLEGLESENEEAVEKNRELVEELEGLKSQIGDANSKLGGILLNIKNEEGKLSAKNEELGGLQSELEKKYKEKGGLEADLSRLNSELATLNSSKNLISDTLEGYNETISKNSKIYGWLIAIILVAFGVVAGFIAYPAYEFFNEIQDVKYKHILDNPWAIFIVRAPYIIMLGIVLGIFVKFTRILFGRLLTLHQEKEELIKSRIIVREVVQNAYFSTDASKDNQAVITRVKLQARHLEHFLKTSKPFALPDEDSIFSHLIDNVRERLDKFVSGKENIVATEKESSDGEAEEE